MSDAKQRDILKGLRFYPLFIVLALGLGVGWERVFHATITRGWVYQHAIPRWHLVKMAPGDWIDMGARGADRPVLVHHADGSVTNAGQLRGWLRHLHDTPAFLATAVAWITTLLLLARIWPRERDESPRAALPPAGPTPDHPA